MYSMGVIMTGRNRNTITYLTVYDTARSIVTSFPRKEGEMKSGGEFFFSSSHRRNGMEARSGLRAYGAVLLVVVGCGVVWRQLFVCSALVRRTPPLQEAPSFRYKIGNTVYNVVHVSSNLNEIGSDVTLTGRGRGCVRLGACVRGITDSHRPTFVDRPFNGRDPGQRDRLTSDKRLEMGRGAKVEI
jgi:hypothetical protein